MDKSEIANYADDNNTPYAIDKVILKLKIDYFQLIEWLSCNYMRDNEKKLQLLLPNLGEDVDTNEIKGKNIVKLLRIKIDNKLHF